MAEEPESQYQRALADFKRSVEVTRDVRFQAAIRLGQRQTASAYVVSTLSLFVIAISIIPNVYQIEAYQNQILLGSSIVLSAFVIFTSLIDNSQNFFHQGELLHSCARKVATVYHELKSIDPNAESPKNWSLLRSLQREYRVALDECPVNHSSVDFLKVQARKPSIFGNDYTWKHQWLEVRFKKIQCFFGTWLWIVPHVIVLAAVCHLIFRFILSTAPYISH